MLVRVDGAKEGIREYLEKGHKQGREFSRDMLDERVVLSGDLEVTDKIITSMTTDADRYLHVTLSFKEDYVSQETLDAVVRDFRTFAFSAFDGDEYNMYAEAHLPKIKSYLNRQTGELVERKPHIHIVIPKTNLLSGLYLSPFGRYEHNESFVEAFQEYTNHQYGLASPKDNRRIGLTSAAEMIARYKGDLFSAQGRAVKERVLNAVLDQKIIRYEDFEALINSFGDVRERNAGKASRYLNLKIEGDAKGINLKEYVFSREFIELSDAEKRQRLTGEIARKYEKAGEARRAPAALEKTLRDWHERRALEVKYLNSGSKRTYTAYRAADAATRQTLLAAMRDEYYAKHRPQETDHERHNASASLERINDNLRAAGRQLQTAERHIEQARRTDAAAGRGKLADRRNRAAVAAAIQRFAGDQIEPAAERIERSSDSVAGQLDRDERERVLQVRTSDADLFKAIKRELDGNRLLAVLSHSHGVIPAKYEVTKGKDGSDRIRAGDRNLNVSDFLTKELHLSWQEAAQILRDAYAEQRNDVAVRASREPSKELWREFLKWDKGRVQELAERWKVQKASEPARRKAIRDEYREQKQQIEAQRTSKQSGGAAGIRTALSVLRMQRVQKEMSLRADIDRERAALREDKHRSLSEHERYRLYLVAQAQAGNVVALAELRRMQPVQTRSTTDATRLLSTDADLTSADMLHAELSYTVNRDGDVVYLRNDEHVIVDRGEHVEMIQNDDETTETAMRFAIAKWGSTLDIAGSPERMRRAAELAAEKYMNVTFTNPALNEIMAERKAQIARERLNLFREFGSTRPASTQAISTERKMSRVDDEQTAAEQTAGERERKRADAGKQANQEQYDAGQRANATDAARGQEIASEAAELSRQQAIDAERVKQQYIESDRQRASQIQKEQAQKQEAVKSQAQQDAARQEQAARDEAAHRAFLARERTAAQDRVLADEGKAPEQGREAYQGPGIPLGHAPESRSSAPDPWKGADSQIAPENARIPEYHGEDAKSPYATHQQRDQAYANLRDKRGISEETIAYTERQGAMQVTSAGQRTFNGSEKEPAILAGDPNNVHIVKTGEDAMAMHDMARREGLEPPTTIIAGENFKGTLAGSERAKGVLQSADNVTIHDDAATAQDVVNARGRSEGVALNELPEGTASLEELNVRQRAEAEAVGEHEQQKEPELRLQSPRAK
ncbi:LPD7 domain-containing protein [Caballeronia grimmiae]|uniref:LPD7 domain-containing protein n=1 Tax=Caballeronia grimmiae TaxID=1071679 RepID=UPI0038BB4A40